jgi:gliding motility-associated-like protein
MNGGAPFTITEDWWNYIDQPTATIPTSQSTSQFTVVSLNDCYNFMMMGLYYQTTTCNTCIPQPAGNITLASTGTGTCAPNSGTVTTTPSGGTPPYSYNWQPGNQSTPTVTGLPPGSYTVVVTDATGCAVSADTVVVPPGVPPTAQFTLSPYPGASFPGQLCMTDNTVGATQWNWVINGVPSATTSSYCYTIQDTTPICVTLFVQDTFGCADSASDCVTVLGDAVIIIPNVFTPNGDQTNDSLVITWTNLASLKMEIYDRWGVHIRTYDALITSWDGKNKEGKECTDGVYYYICTAATHQDEIKLFTGFVHLIRAK